jgi:hypothetical protein
MPSRRPPEPAQQQSRPQPAGAAGPAYAEPQGRAKLLQLQRTIGNRATARMLQRDPTATKTIEKGRQAPPPPSTPAVVPPLSPKEREELERFTGNRIDRAFVAFVSACKDNREAVKAAAKADAENTALFIDIATGFLIPGLSKGIAKLAGNLPVNASNASYRIAIAALNTDTTKAIFTGATKAANQFLKNNSMTLFGETETDHFIKSLEALFHRGADEIDKNLPNLTDTELGVVCSMYDPSVADVDAFRAEIHALVTRFQREVLKKEDRPEFQVSQAHTYTKHQQHAWVDLGGGRKRLALLVYDKLSVPFQPARETWRFFTWISPDMEQMVLSKWGKGPWGTGLPTVKKDAVAGLALP